MIRRPTMTDEKTLTSLASGGPEAGFLRRSCLPCDDRSHHGRIDIETHAFAQLMRNLESRIISTPKYSLPHAGGPGGPWVSQSWMTQP